MPKEQNLAHLQPSTFPPRNANFQVCYKGDMYTCWVLHLLLPALPQPFPYWKHCCFLLLHYLILITRTKTLGFFYTLLNLHWFYSTPLHLFSVHLILHRAAVEKTQPPPASPRSPQILLDFSHCKVANTYLFATSINVLNKL